MPVRSGARREAGWLLAVGFLGGFLASLAGHPAFLARAETYLEDTVLGPIYEITDSEGRKALSFGETSGGEGSGGFWFFDHGGHVRLSGCVFPGGELSCIGLMSPNVDINPKVFMRLDGTNQNGMLFFKNSRDQHRIDLGVDINDADENPYLVYFNREGKKHSVFGQFPYL